MCGIVGSIGLDNPRDYIIGGLKTLEYRGYDSAGVAFLDSAIKIIRYRRYWLLYDINANF